MIADWFDERVRPLIGADPEDRGSGTWQPVAGLAAEAGLEEIERRLARAHGAPPRVALTLFAGWSAGYLAWAVAIGVLRDGVLVSASRPGALLLLRHPEGYYHDIRLVAPRAVVAADHPWAGRPGVATVADRQALDGAAVTEIGRACAPLVDAIARRSGRGRDGLWAQVADEVGDAAFSLQPEVAPADARAAVERLLRAPGAPWKHVPALWLAGDVLLKHRGSCCLYYRRAAEDADYCTTCVFRSRADVEALMLTHDQEPS